MTMSTLKTRAFTLFLASCLGVLSTAGARADDNNSAAVADWRAYYQNIWNADACAQKESWDTYWGWVRQFFLGNFLDRGWFADTTPIAGKISDPSKRQRIQTELTNLGRSIASEWSKPNSCRAIDNAMLKAWYSDIKGASSRDSGDGTEIQHEITVISQKIHFE